MKKVNGITLISLVITIIILIILAGVTINLSVGENGLLNRAKEAKQKYEIAEAKEYIELKINECIIDKNGNATLQDIVNYLSEDSNVTYYVALEEIALVAGEVSVGEPTKIYVVYNTYQFKIEENKNVEFISIVDVDLEGRITIESEVQEYLGKNEEGNYTASILLKATGETEIVKLEIQNPDGTILELEPNELTTVGKNIEIEFDKEYAVILTTKNGHKYTKKIIEKSEEIIKTAEELANFRNRVNSGLTYAGKTVKLGENIDLSTVCGKNVNGEEISWEPIGKKEKPFKGIFDGDYKKIKKLYINTVNDYQGLFGCIVDAEVRKTIIDSDSSITVGGYSSALVGISENSTIINCGNNANVIGTKSWVGGILGYIENGAKSNIKACYNKGNISSILDGAGGIIGGFLDTIESSNVSLCYNTGNIQADRCSGGIAGLNGNYGIIEYCYNTGTVVAVIQKSSKTTLNLRRNLWWK